MNYKPMKASDWNEKKVKLPVFIQPKVDGVRSVYLNNKGVTGRSLKSHGNRYVTKAYSDTVFMGLDGEMAAEKETHPALCRLTTSALSTHEGEPYILWWLFDYITPKTIALPYSERYKWLTDRYWEIHAMQHHLAANLRIMPSYHCKDMDELLYYDAKFNDDGFEGSCLRRPDGLYKEGYSTVTEGGLLRIKRFVDKDAIVVSIQEGQRNENTATIAPSGYTERSTHKENMVPNGMVGALDCIDIETQKPITVSAGSMDHDDRKRFFQNPHLIVGQTIKYKTFPKGVKDKPRFPTFQCIRSASD